MDNDKLSHFRAPLSTMRFQSQLGKETERIYNEGKNIVRLSLARVVKVNYKYNTVDVITTLYKNSTIRNPNDEGRYSARLPVKFGGRTPEGKVYGSNTLVTVGSIVLIGFMEGDKDYPIVINIYSDANNQSQLTRTTFSSADESDEDLQRELWQLFTLYPSMTYHNVDGNGNKEVTFSGKTFMYMTDTDPNNYYVQDGGFDYEHLPSSRYANGELIEPKSPNSPTMLYVHQGIYEDHRVTFFIKSDGTVRVGSRHKDGEGITFHEMKTDGTFSLVHKRGTTNPEEDVEKFSQFKLNDQGNFLLQSNEHRLEVTDQGILIDGEPITAIGGGGSVDLSDIQAQIDDINKKVIAANTSIEIINGKIELKADATIVDTLKDSVTENTSNIEIAFNKIEEKVSSETYSEDIENITSKQATLEEKVTDAVNDIEEVSKNVTYKAEIISTNGIVFKNDNIHTTLFCLVYRGAEDITDTINASRFRWTRVSNDSADDEIWNQQHATGTKSIDVTADDVDKRATFDCEILDA